MIATLNAAPVEWVVRRAFYGKVETYYHTDLSHKTWNLIAFAASKTLP